MKKILAEGYVEISVYNGYRIFINEYEDKYLCWPSLRDDQDILIGKGGKNWLERAKRKIDYHKFKWNNLMVWIKGRRGD